MARTLLLTVGTGDVDNLETSLMRPLALSMCTGGFACAILLPSCETEANAVEAARRSDLAVTIEALPQPGQENDADLCFAHFEAVIDRLVAGGTASSEIVADFTRGTKAMSAALVLAAVRHGIPSLRYIMSHKRDARGMVVAGTETLAEIATGHATGRALIDRAAGLFRHGDFAAVGQLLGGGEAHVPSELRQELCCLAAAARFFAAWDRLDYRSAHCLGGDLPAIGHVPTRLHAMMPTEAQRSWVAALAVDPPRGDTDAMVRFLRLLIADVFANGERRIDQGAYEDAVIRAYRVVEMLGQTRLFAYGYDSEAVPEDDPRIAPIFDKRMKKGDGIGSENADRPGCRKVGREVVGSLLKGLGDPLAKDLNRIADATDSDGRAYIKLRNHSILAHGFAATGPAEAAPIRAVYRTIEDIIRADSPDAEARLLVARFSPQARGAA